MHMWLTCISLFNINLKRKFLYINQSFDAKSYEVVLIPPEKRNIQISAFTHTYHKDTYLCIYIYTNTRTHYIYISNVDSCRYVKINIYIYIIYLQKYISNQNMSSIIKNWIIICCFFYIRGSPDDSNCLASFTKSCAFGPNM